MLPVEKNPTKKSPSIAMKNKNKKHTKIKSRK